MKIGILTLHFHVNYGGILQAYALQRFLTLNGHEVWHIAKINKSLKHYLAVFVYFCLRFFFRYTPQRNIINDFVRKNIRTRKYYSYNDIPPNEFQVLIVGSDQIWRAEYYFPIEEAYLDFAKEWKIKRIGYAISIGKNELDYTSQQFTNCGNLVSLFDKLSFREASLVGLFEDKFGVTSQLVLDPVLLLPPKEYSKFNNNNKYELFSYFIIASELKTQITNFVSNRLNLKETNITVGKIINGKIPSIEQWISCIMNSKFVVTDSFHGCIFCIMFNKPFIVIPNSETGNERLVSILGKVGLEKRMVRSLNEENISLLYQDIDWKTVNRKLDRLRQFSQNFLLDSLK